MARGGAHGSCAFAVLGGVRAELDGDDVALPGQLRALLGILLADRDVAVPTDVIIERLWPGEAPRTAVKGVQVLAGRLRRALEPGLADAASSRLIVTTLDGYRLAPGETDLDRYEAAAELARRSEDPVLALASADAALATWSGRPWGDQADEGWLAARVTALEERHRNLEEIWAELILRSGRVDGAIATLQHLASAQPLREQRWAHLMTGLYRSGRQADALRAYDEARGHLREELGLEPGPELRRLQIAVLQHDPSLAQPSSGTTDHTEPTSFVGRDAELAHLGRAVDRDRVVTVIGLGGMGKTRLVDEFAHRRRRSGHRVLRASMGATADPTRVSQHVAGALGLFTDDAGSPLDVITAAIGAEPTLLVLDGVERFTAEVGNLALQLLDRLPTLRIVVTSRVALGIGVERMVPIGPLPLPATGQGFEGTALELMVQRGGLDDVALDPAMIERLRTSCALAGGVPLLIEVAARTFEVGLQDPAVGPDPTSASHHVVMRACIEQALDSVDETARAVLVRTASLPDGVSEETVAALQGVGRDAARRALRQLAWSRLVDARSGRSSLRFHTLDPVREVLIEAQPPEEQAASLARAVDAVEAVFASVRPEPTQPIVVARLDVAADEHDNLQYLIADRLRTTPSRALELTIAGAEFWPVRGHIADGRRWIEEAIAAAAPEGEPAWRAVFALSRTTRGMGEVATLRPRLEQTVHEAAEHDADPVLRAGLLMYLTIARGWQGDTEGATAALDDATALNGLIGSAWTSAQLDRIRGLHLALRGDLVGARAFQHSFALRMVEMGDPVGAATGWYLGASLGDMAGCDDVMADIERARELADGYGDVSLLGQLLLVEARALRRAGDERGRELLDEAAERLERSGGLRAAAIARRDLGLIELEKGELDAALGHLRQAFTSLVGLDRSASGLGLAGLAAVAAEQGRREVAEQLAAGAAGLRATAGSPSAEDDRQIGELLSGLGFEVEVAVTADGELLALVAELS